MPVPSIPENLFERLHQTYAEEHLGSSHLAAVPPAQILGLISPIISAHPEIFGSNTALAMTAARSMCDQLAALLPKLPAAWFHVFHDAAKAGLITPAAWGVIARSIYVAMHTRMRGRAGSRGFLEGFRDASPEGLMTPFERSMVAMMPATATLYRTGSGDSAREAAQGLNWTNHKKNTWLGIYRREMGFYGPVRSDAKYYAVGATVPREAILCLISCDESRPVGEDNYSSLLVDFDKVDLKTVVDISTLNMPLAIVSDMARNIAFLGTPLRA